MTFYRNAPSVDFIEDMFRDLINDSILEGRRSVYIHNDVTKKLEIDRVIINPPATIIKWRDKTKTVVKCQDKEPYDPEKGIALCFVKKLYGNNAKYYTIMKQIIKKEMEGKK